jgi:F-type H+-transporting ATPase subunit b
VILLTNSSWLAAAEGGGFNPLDPHFGGATFWTWVIFLVSLPVMWKFVFGPITKALEARDRKAEDAIAKAQEAKSAAEKAKTETLAQLEQARAETSRLVAEARERSERQARELIDNAKAEAARSLDKARSEIQAEKTRALAEIRDEVVELSISAAGKILRRDVDDAAHQSFVKDMLAGVEGAGRRKK